MFKVTPSSLPNARQANSDKEAGGQPRYGVNSNVRRTAKEHQANRFVRNTKLSKYHGESFRNHQARHLMLKNIQPKMLPQNHLLLHDETTTAMMDKRVKDLESCINAQDVPQESEWGNLPRVTSRHEIEEAKRLAKLINPKRWREIFLGYCSTLLSLRSARPKRWTARDEQLPGHWFFQPWFQLGSNDRTKQLSTGLQFGFSNFISERPMANPTVQTVDFSSEKWEDICEPEPLIELLQSLGEGFNRGSLGCFIKNCEACPMDVVALLRLFIRRCSDKGIVLTEQTTAETRKNSIGQGACHQVHGGDFVDGIKRAVRYEDSSELLNLLESASNIFSWRHAVCSTLEEREEAYMAQSLFALFMMPTIPVVSALMKPKANSQAANILAFFNRHHKALPSLASQKVVPVTAEDQNIFAVIKLSRSVSQSDVLLVSNFANYASEVSIPLRGRRLHDPRTIHAGEYENAVQSASAMTRNQKSAVTVLVPPRSVFIAEMVMRDT